MAARARRFSRALRDLQRHHVVGRLLLQYLLPNLMLVVDVMRLQRESRDFHCILAAIRARGASCHPPPSRGGARAVGGGGGVRACRPAWSAGRSLLRASVPPQQGMPRKARAAPAGGRRLAPRSLAVALARSSSSAALEASPPRATAAGRRVD
ncbi:unnamed protein product [Urochloa humidicola]